MDAAAINGTGTGQPLGILNAAGVNVVATGANGDAPTWI
jgi:HK97 family phage major capsid protein